MPQTPSPGCAASIANATADATSRPIPISRTGRSPNETIARISRIVPTVPEKM